MPRSPRVKLMVAAANRWGRGGKETEAMLAVMRRRRLSGLARDRLRGGRTGGGSAQRVPSSPVGEPRLSEEGRWRRRHDAEVHGEKKMVLVSYSYRPLREKFSQKCYGTYHIEYCDICIEH